MRNFIPNLCGLLNWHHAWEPMLKQRLRIQDMIHYFSSLLEHQICSRNLISKYQFDKSDSWRLLLIFCFCHIDAICFRPLFFHLKSWGSDSNSKEIKPFLDSFFRNKKVQQNPKSLDVIPSSSSSSSFSSSSVSVLLLLPRFFSFFLLAAALLRAAKGNSMRFRNYLHILTDSERIVSIENKW